MSPIPVLLNPQAGSAPANGPEGVTSVLRKAGVDVRVESCDPEALESTVRRLATEDVAVLAIVGGDGSHRTAAQVLAGGPTALAAFPGGRRNHFPRRLGLETMESAAAALAKGRMEEVAVGTVSGHVFLNTAVVGGYNQVVRLRERVRPVLGTWCGGVLAWAVVWARWPTQSVTVRTPQGVLSRTVPVVWTGTGPGTFPAPQNAPRPRTGDPLELLLPPGGGRSGALRVVPWLLRHGFTRGPGLRDVLEVIQTSWAEVDGPGPIPVTLDGEPMTVDGPARLALGERTLRVVVPPAPD